MRVLVQGLSCSEILIVPMYSGINAEYMGTIKISEHDNPYTSTRIYKLETELRTNWTVLDKATKLKMLEIIFDVDTKCLEILLNNSFGDYNLFCDFARNNQVQKRILQCIPFKCIS
eukprot:TRINITY_DN26235_c0_g1_i3.p4 TRINITY_DN26235_c0_g1~~TRINITY_DN26235_c0_g1_i3.p4  ORF type:complete len:116 (-),score=2.64 TRINITY_DN26235_c0_g1_i3:219-566(-)